MKEAKKKKRRETSPLLETTKAGKDITNKVRFIANHRKLNHDEVWDQFAGPAIDAEFARCVAEATGGSKRIAKAG